MSENPCKPGELGIGNGLLKVRKLVEVCVKISGSIGCVPVRQIIVF